MDISVVMVDDHPLVRQGIEGSLRLVDGIKLLGSSSNVQEALDLIAMYQPDVVLVDLKLNNEHGLDVVRNGRDLCQNSRYLILTSYANEEEILGALEEEVEGYILKEALPEELIAAIMAVGNGKNYYDPSVVQYAMGKGRSKKKPDLSKLTRREMEVLRMLGIGMTNKVISEKMFISEHTVKKHVGAILHKLSFEDRTQAALFAVSMGLHQES